MSVTSDPAHQTPPEEEVPLGALVSTLRAYKRVILGVLAAVAALCIIAATTKYLMSPAQKVTTMRFRLEFEGSELGLYPNGLRFTPAEIATPLILRRAYDKTKMGRFTSFPDFSRSVFILESNPQYEVLAMSYRARLAGAKMSPLERERVRAEWEAKLAAVSKNSFTINYLSLPGSKVPTREVHRVLEVVLREWAAFATREQNVLSYRVDIVTPAILARDTEQPEPVLALWIMRAKANRIMQNLDRLAQIPGTEALRTPQERTSLSEIRSRLEEIVRFRIDPQISAICADGLIADRTTALTFLETQLAHDRRELEKAESTSQSIRDAIALYSSETRSFEAAPEATSGDAGDGSAPAQPEPPTGRQTPTFIDRLVAIANQANSVKYREELIDALRVEHSAAIPLRAEVAYDREMLELVRRAPASQRPVDPAVRASIADTRQELGRLVNGILQIYELLSLNLNPSGVLYRVTGKPATRIARTESITRLALITIVVLLFTLLTSVVLCLAHAWRQTMKRAA